VSKSGAGLIEARPFLLHGGKVYGLLWADDKGVLDAVYSAIC
jgi:hypothetical protein